MHEFSIQPKPTKAFSFRQFAHAQELAALLQDSPDWRPDWNPEVVNSRGSIIGSAVHAG
ncbi:hypothetical protein FB459_2026 [Yimella lutea]|uniref:Uncharacterized protein n=1 Tax=Yimella lutea TaxID=587872 RepID=A0A542EGW9_9MICO|nr:hypothetical protein [Yimella lutea]TQJ14559.1 hypothetical protein FB459_2026 [Yimella lutea]